MLQSSLHRLLFYAKNTTQLVGPTRFSARASISQDYWRNIKEDWGSGDPNGVQRWSPGRGSGGLRPPEAEVFLCETTHNICVKIQQTTVAVT